MSIDAARKVALLSPDPDTKVGAVIICERTDRVISEACNTFPDGVSAHNAQRLKRPEKYSWIEHAERRAIFLAARSCRALGDATMYIYGGFPCPDCARAIIQVGIRQVWSEYDDLNVQRWLDSYKISRVMFKESGVDFRRVRGNGIEKIEET
jgi:dCMP deaminase